MKASGPWAVTGASGFVGAHLCRYFALRGEKVIALQHVGSEPSWRLTAVDREISAASPARAPIERAWLDLSSRAEVQDWVEAAQPSVVLNCAAYGAYPSQTDSDRIFQVNASGVRFLLESLRKVPGFRALVQAGSSSEYGQNCTRPAENSPTLPDSDYSVSKIAASQYVKFFGLKHSFPAWSLRLYSVYGPLEDGSRLIPKALAKAARGELPPLVSPHVSRDFIYIDDVCRAFAAVVDRAPELAQGEIYNIGTGVRTRLEDLVTTLRTAFSIDAKPDWGTMPDRHWDHADWYADPAKARLELDWAARVALLDGLKDTANWMKAHPTVVEESIKYSVV